MLIIDMPMPKSCNECEAKCVSALYGRICGMTRKNVMPFLDKPNRPDWCPIKGVLPEEHGDLIDRDALIEDINKQVRMLDAFGIEELRLIGKEMQKGMIAEIGKQTSVIAAERRDDGTTAD